MKKQQPWRQPWRYSLLAGFLVVIALAVGAMVWVLTGSRDQAMQATLVMFLGELIAVCLVAALVVVVTAEDGE